MVEGPNFGAQNDEDIAAVQAFYRSHPIDTGKLKREVEETLSHLSDRERLVLRLSFGLDNGPTSGRHLTQKEIGEDSRIGRSRWTVGRVQRSALNKLRHPATSQ